MDDFALPNGLAFSPDESVLYVDDSAHKHIRAFDVRADGTLANGRILLDMASEDPGVPDGLKVDVQGNVFCTGPRVGRGRDRAVPDGAHERLPAPHEDAGRAPGLSRPDSYPATARRKRATSASSL